MKRQIGLELKAEGIRRSFNYLYGENIGEYLVRALSEKFIDGSGYSHNIIGESAHILINSNKTNENSLLNHGLMFYVEHGTESANNDYEISALKIQKLLQLII